MALNVRRTNQGQIALTIIPPNENGEVLDPGQEFVARVMSLAEAQRLRDELTRALAYPVNDWRADLDAMHEETGRRSGW